MSWNVEIADAAYQDLRDIYAYIAFELRSPCVYYVARDEVVSVGRILYSHRDTDAVFAPGWST